jgi:hypothetical protein
MPSAPAIPDLTAADVALLRQELIESCAIHPCITARELARFITAAARAGAVMAERERQTA